MTMPLLLVIGDCSQFTVKAATGAVWGHDISKANVTSLSSCCDACTAYPLCTSFTYYNGGCFLKDGQVATWVTSDPDWPNGYPSDLSSGFVIALEVFSAPPGKTLLARLASAPLRLFKQGEAVQTSIYKFL